MVGQIEASDAPISDVQWPGSRRIIRSIYPPIDLFEDIAAPEDWPLLISAEQKTNPRLMDSIGALDLVPTDRRVGGPGASYLMAPFTHTSPDRPSRFSDGRRGVLYIANDFDTAVHETIHHHALFMAQTDQAPGWTSQFRELVIAVDAALHDIRGLAAQAVLSPDDYTYAQRFAQAVRGAAGQGIVYPSVRLPGGECVALFYPDLARNPVQGRHLDYHWDGARVDLVRDTTNNRVYRVE